MKRLGLAVLILLALSASAERTVTVRLFWLHPPEKIRIEPQQATVRSCSTCAGKALPSAINLDAYSQVTIVSGRARIAGEGFQPFTFSGELTIEPRDGALLLTLKMPLEDYVAAVLNGESSGFRSDEALKAMAVAARTYAVDFGARHKLEGFDFCDTTHCQDVRLGIDSPRVRAAVVATEGELLWYEGRPAATYYHRNCGGETEAAAALDPQLRAPYLRRHQDAYCPRDEWHSEITKADLAAALKQYVRAPVATVEVKSRTESGRVETLLINQRPVTATDFRFAIGRSIGWDKLRSDLYEIQDRGDRFSFRGRGQGHGVGLCQSGADAMGMQGKTYRDILAFYYPGTSLGINAQGLRWQKLSGEQIDVLTTQAKDAQVLLPIAERALSNANDKTGWALSGHPQIKVFPTIDIYRDATGEPGWVAASTRGLTIRLQPLRILQEQGALESTLRHEFLHMVIESHAHVNTPLWLSEGLVIYLSYPERVRAANVDVTAVEKRLRTARTEAEMRTAYRDAGAAVADVLVKKGLAHVLDAISHGVTP